MVAKIETLEQMIRQEPGKTEIQLARAIHGPNAYQQQVNQDCVLLVNRGKVERRGEGGHADPFRYYPISSSEVVTSSPEGTINDSKVKCSRCGSEQIHAEKRGWSIWTGFLGSGKIIITCLRCGHQFRPGDGA